MGYDGGQLDHFKDRVPGDASHTDKDEYCPGNGPDIQCGCNSRKPGEIGHIRHSNIGPDSDDQTPHDRKPAEVGHHGLDTVFAMVLLCMVVHTEHPAERDMQDTDPDRHDHKCRNCRACTAFSPAAYQQVPREDDRIPRELESEEFGEEQAEDDARYAGIPENR